MLKWILAIVFAVAATVIHLSRSKGKKNYIKGLLFGNGKNHIAYLDYLRVLATVFVITAHTTSAAIGTELIGDTTSTILQIVYPIALCCNNMFFMISGALVLSGGSDDDNVFEFYRKRLLRVIIPCFAYYSLSEILTYGTDFLKPENWKNYLILFVRNDSSFTPHFWMLWVIVILYLEAPILRVAVKHMSERMFNSLIVAIFILHTIFTFLPIFGFAFAYVPFLASYTSVFILGYYLTTDAAMKHYKTFMWGGLISLILTAVFILTRSDSVNYIYNNSPLALFMAAAIFLFFRKHADDIFSRTNAVIDMLCKYSFSILMIHWYVLFITVKEYIGISSTDFRVFGGIIVTVLLTVVIGLAIAIVYDNTVVLVLRSAADLIIDFFVNLVKLIKAKLKKSPSESDS